MMRFWEQQEVREVDGSAIARNMARLALEKRAVVATTAKDGTRTYIIQCTRASTVESGERCCCRRSQQRPFE